MKTLVAEVAIRTGICSAGSQFYITPVWDTSQTFAGYDVCITDCLAGNNSLYPLYQECIPNSTSPGRTLSSHGTERKKAAAQLQIPQWYLHSCPMLTTLSSRRVPTFAQGRHRCPRLPVDTNLQHFPSIPEGKWTPTRTRSPTRSRTLLK